MNHFDIVDHSDRDHLDHGSGRDDHSDHDEHDDHDIQSRVHAHDDYGGHAPWEHAGIYVLAAHEKYLWSAARSASGEYAAREMKLLIVHANTTEDAKETAETTWRTANWSYVRFGEALEYDEWPQGLSRVIRS